MSPKVRDLAESRTGVLASMYIAIARGKYYKYIRPGCSRWVALVSAHFHFNSWMVTVCLDFWQMVFESSRQWCTFGQWNNVVRGQQRIPSGPCYAPASSDAAILSYWCQYAQTDFKKIPASQRTSSRIMMA